MTSTEARDLVRAHLGVYRAAFVEAPGWPLLDHPQARFTLCERVGHAYDALRDRKAHLVKMGYKVTAGSLGANVLRLELGDETRVIGIDKPKRARGQSQVSLDLRER